MEPEQPWPAPKSKSDLLADLVLLGDLGRVREFFDSAFWRHDPIQPSWYHLKIALQCENKPMVRLLMTWGATATEAEVAEFSGSPRYDYYIKLLRLGGLKISPAASPAPQKEIVHLEEEVFFKDPAEPDEGFIIKSFVDGKFIDHRIGTLPKEWRNLLQALQENGAPDAVIAGGALRDTFNKAAVRDVDIFIPGENSTRKNRKLLKKAFAAANLPVKQQMIEHETYRNMAIFSQFPDPTVATEPQPASWFGGRKNKITESWKVIANKIEYNIIFVYKPLAPHAQSPAPFFALRLIESFDFGLCQIACNGRMILQTDAYNNDVKNKRITLVRSPTNTEHLGRIVNKYHDWELCPESKKLLAKPRKPSSGYDFGDYY